MTKIMVIAKLQESPEWKRAFSKDPERLASGYQRTRWLEGAENGMSLNS
jgi:hypothetical protein